MNVLWLLTIIGVSPYVVWDKGYDAGGADKAHGLVFADTSLLFVGETSGDVLLYKLSKASDSLWSTTYDHEGNEDIGYDVAVAPNGAMFVGGTTKESGGEPLTLVCAFNASEGLLWATSLFRGSNGPPSLFCRHNDSCFVTGWYNELGSYDCFFGLFEEDGTYRGLRVWSNGGSENTLSSIEVDSEGNVYLAGGVIVGCGLSKHELDGSLIWGDIYSLSPMIRGWQCRVAPSQDIYLCGDDSFDFLLLKWDPEGTRLWNPAKTYDLGAAEYCRDMAVDSGPAGPSDCYLAGWQDRGSDEDLALVKTDSAGNLLWAWVDTVPGKQEIEAIEVDNEGYIYLAGSSHNGADWDALVMKIRQPLTVTGKLTDSTGKVMKSIPVAVSGDTTLEVTTDNDGSYTITIYNGGNYTLKPNLAGYTFEPPQREYAPLAYRMWDQDFENGHWTAVSEKPPTGAVTLEVRGAAVFFSIPGDQRGTLNIYSSSGQLVKRLTVKGEASINLTSTLPSGIYFVQLDAGCSRVTRKAVIIR